MSNANYIADTLKEKSVLSEDSINSEIEVCYLCDRIAHTIVCLCIVHCCAAMSIFITVTYEPLLFSVPQTLLKESKKRTSYDMVRIARPTQEQMDMPQRGDSKLK